MDRLVHEGVMFTRGYIASPVCTPSRYIAMTGRHSSQPGAIEAVAARRPGQHRLGHAALA